MRHLIFATALFASATVLAACMPQAPQQAQQQAPNQQQTNAAPAAPSNKGVGDVASVPAAEAIDAQFMVGRWGDNGDCNNDIVINADNSFTSYTGGQGQWSLNGDTLRLEGKNGAFDMRLEFIDHNTLRITNPDGSVGTSQRCG